MPLKLTPGERLIATMLADVMEHLKVKSQIDPAQIKEMLVNNEDWALPIAYRGLFSDEGKSDHDIEETHDILTMWRVVEDTMKGISDADKGGVDLDQFRFEGFDANNDPHYFIAGTMIRLGLYTERDPLINSHSSITLDIYRQMLPRFQDEWRSTCPRPLSLDQLKRIVDYREPS